MTWLPEYRLDICSDALPAGLELRPLTRFGSVWLYACEVDASEALRIRGLVRERFAASKLFPVLAPFDRAVLEAMGCADPLRPEADVFCPANDLDSLAPRALAAAASLEPVAIFQQLETRFKGKYPECWPDRGLTYSEAERITPFEWQSLYRRPFVRDDIGVLLVLLPIDEPWQAALASMPFANREGGWAGLDHPQLPAAEHTLGQMTFDLMVGKHWWDQYQAEIVIMAYNQMEWTAASPANAGGSTHARDRTVPVLQRCRRTVQLDSGVGG